MEEPRAPEWRRLVIGLVRGPRPCLSLHRIRAIGATPIDMLAGASEGASAPEPRDEGPAPRDDGKAVRKRQDHQRL